MFRCERCGSRYNALYAAALDNCPRCQIRERTAAPLTFKVFRLPAAESRSTLPEERSSVNADKQAWAG